MNKGEFYKNKLVVRTEWWLHSCELPDLRWGRLRVFNDGTADSCFEEGGTVYGFENEQYASYFLSEDEYVQFESIDPEDEEEYGIQRARIALPEWPSQDQEFEFLGTY